MDKPNTNPHTWAAAALAHWLPRWYREAARKIEAEAQKQADALRRLAK